MTVILIVGCALVAVTLVSAVFVTVDPGPGVRIPNRITGPVMLAAALLGAGGGAKAAAVISHQRTIESADAARLDRRAINTAEAAAKLMYERTGAVDTSVSDLAAVYPQLRKFTTNKNLLIRIVALRPYPAVSVHAENSWGQSGYAATTRTISLKPQSS